MRILLIILSSTILVLNSCQNEVKKENTDENSVIKEITFYTPDSIKIFGDLYQLDKQAAIILLFHQGGSNARGEYISIIPRLLEKGYNVLAIDQRMGGQIYGNYNRTIANIPDNSFENDYGYCDAYNNLEGALDFAIESGFTGRKILWGSSYSAALAIQLGNQRQEDVSGVLAFSPSSGNAVKECPTDEHIKEMKIPLLLLRPSNEMERESAQAQLELAKEYNHQTYVAKYGTHGSSMLEKERVGNDVNETWETVESFLDEIEKD